MKCDNIATAHPVVILTVCFHIDLEDYVRRVEVPVKLVVVVELDVVREVLVWQWHC